MAKNQNPMGERAKRVQEALSGVDKKLAVMSGKGGVGKTTIAINLAAYLAKDKRVGLLDADVDCPNVNKFLGINEPFGIENGKITPIEKFGIKVVSFASLQEREDEPIIWRGPMLSNAITEILEKTRWGHLDYLVADLPPGTSDVALTIMQILKPDGMIVVTTPQKASVVDAKKSANMAKKLNVPVLGIIENMGGDIFGEGGGEKAAEELGIDFLGRLGLSKVISRSGEEGKPFILDNGNRDFEAIVENLG